MANKRLIDANALKNHVQAVSTHWLNDWSTIGVLAAVDKQPTVDAVEVVHGHWYKAQHHPYRCSNCGEMALLDMYGESHYRSNYCPNCGAKMDGGDEDV